MKSTGMEKIQRQLGRRRAVAEDSAHTTGFGVKEEHEAVAAYSRRAGFGDIEAGRHGNCRIGCVPTLLREAGSRSLPYIFVCKPYLKPPSE